MSRVFEALRRSEAENKLSNPDPTLTNPEEAARTDANPELGLSGLKVVHPIPSESSRIIMLDAPNSLGAEKFRVLAARLRHMQMERPTLSVVVITSSCPGDGKSTVAANLAVALASRSKGQVALVDGDLRIPRQAMLWGVGESAGLGEFLQGNRNLEEIVMTVNGCRLNLVTAGAAQAYPPDLLTSPRLKEGIEQLRESFSWVVIDSPPILPTADTNLLLRCSDGALVVARQDATVRKDLKQSIAALEKKKVLGVVLNGTDPSERNYYGSKYYGMHTGTAQKK